MGKNSDVEALVAPRRLGFGDAEQYGAFWVLIEVVVLRIGGVNIYNHGVEKAFIGSVTPASWASGTTGRSVPKRGQFPGR